jgi:hypothetical protein
MEITLNQFLKEVEDALRRGYSIGYVDGYSKGRDPHNIESNALISIVEHHLEDLKNKYEN